MYVCAMQFVHEACALLTAVLGASATTADPQLRADGHVSVIGGRSGKFQTRLRKRCAGRSCNTPGSPPGGATVQTVGTRASPVVTIGIIEVCQQT